MHLGQGAGSQAPPSNTLPSFPAPGEPQPLCPPPQGFPTAQAVLAGSREQPRARPSASGSEGACVAKGPRIPTLGAGGLFITLAPLQTDVSLYFELALNRSLISSLSHGLKPEGECEGTGGESAGLAVLPRLPVPVPRRAHGGLGARSYGDGGWLETPGWGGKNDDPRQKGAAWGWCPSPSPFGGS